MLAADLRLNLSAQETLRFYILLPWYVRQSREKSSFIFVELRLEPCPAGERVESS